jgi:head-tail adaptor
MPVASGEFRHRLTLHAPEGTSGTGDPAPAVDLAASIEAKIEAVPLQFQLQERLAAGGQNVQTLYSITVRYRDDVLQQYEWHEDCCMQRIFQILSIIPDDKLLELQMTCVVGQR